MQVRINMHTLRRLRREELGAELVEFALAASLLVLLLFGMVQWMLAMYAYHFTTYAAQQGARFATVRGYTWSKNTATNCSTAAPPNFTIVYACTASSADIQNYVQSLATTWIAPSSVTIDTANVWPGATPDGVVCAQANSQGCLVKVTVNYTVHFLPFVHASALSIGATSEAVILQ
jgi:Flp pilus assembly protein TadG